MTAKVLNNCSITLRWVSYLLDYSGFAEHGRQCIAGLAQAGVRVQAVPVSYDPGFLNGYSGIDRTWLRLALQTTVSDGPCVFFVPPTTPRGEDFYALLRARNPGHSRYLAYTMFETAALPSLWVDLLGRMDEIWVPSRFNRASFIRAGIPKEKIWVMPFGIDLDRFDPGRVAPIPLAEKSGFCFLSILQWTPRKGWDLLLKAYLKAFSRTDDVCLLLRANPFGDVVPIAMQVQRFLMELGSSFDRAPKIVVLDQPVPYDRYPALLAAADAFVLPTRGEGWGAPFMEAMAMELPTIGTRWSAQTDFMNDENSFLIDIEGIVPVTPEMVTKAWYFAGQRWAEPSVEHLARLMRHVFDHRGEAKAKGRQARLDLLRSWSIPQVTQKKIERLLELQAMTKAASGKTSGIASATPTQAIQHCVRMLKTVAERPVSASQEVSELKQETALKAPERRGLGPDAADPAQGRLFPIIQWAGHVFDYHGYAVHSRLCLDSLVRRNIPLKILPFSYNQRFINELEPERAARWRSLMQAEVEGGTLICFSVPTLLDGTDVYRWHKNKYPHCAGYVGVTTFETDRIPAEWVSVCNQMDELWVPSRFNRETFARAGVQAEKLAVFPTGIDTERFDPARVVPLSIPDTRGFRFLSVFQWTFRKGWDVLLRAYLSAFSKADEVSLIIKAFPYRDTSLSIQQRVHRFLRSLGKDPMEVPPIVVLEDLIGERDMPALFAAADAFVLPTRGEGFGLPLLEAMAMGLPTIATRWSGHLDFMNDANSFLIDVERLTAVDISQQRESPFYRADHRWAEPSVEHTAALMRWVYDHPDAARAKGRLARSSVTRECHLDRFGSWLVNRFAVSAGHAGLPSSSPLSDLVPKGSEVVRAAEPPPIPLVWEAPIFDPSGYAEEARQFIKRVALERPVSVTPVGRQSETFTRGLDPGERDFFASLFHRPVSTPFVHLMQVPGYALRRVPSAAYAIGRTTFETDSLPHDWVARCNALDEIWVPTEFNRETFRSAGVHVPIHVVPEGVDSEFFRPVDNPLPIENRRDFVFLSIFEWIYRKGWDVLLQAWAQAFQPDDPVCLVLRTYPVNRIEDGAAGAEIERRIDAYLAEHLGLGRSDLAPILVLGNQVAQRDMPSLYAAADAFVLPSRGEGWGRPYSEAMACGLPTIGTRWGGNLTFMNDDNSFLVDLEALVPVDERMEFPHYRGHRWAEPSVEHLSAILREVYGHRDQARLRGDRARREMIARWSWRQAAATVHERLHAIERQLTSGAAGRRAPASPASASPDLSLVWQGSQLVHHSFARINRELCRRLVERSDVEVSIVPYEPDDQSIAADPRLRPLLARVHAPLSRPTQVHVRHQWPPDFNPPPCGHWVLIQPWEYGRIPESWVEPINRQVDQVWVPSRHTLKSYLASGVAPQLLEVVPNGVDTERYHPGARPMQLPTAKRFKFLFVGGTIWRKGIDVLLHAFCRAFSAADDVALVIKDMGQKSFYRGQTAGDDILRLQADRAAPEIVFLQQSFSDDELPGLYAACDCLVHPYRGEGFAMPVLEAMACGLPVVVTAGGATDDFCGDANAYSIPSRPRAIRSDATRFAGGLGWVLEPDPDRLLTMLRWIHEHREEAKNKGRAGRTVALTYNWSNIAATVVDRLRTLRTRPIRRDPR